MDNDLLIVCDLVDLICDHRLHEFSGQLAAGRMESRQHECALLLKIVREDLCHHSLDRGNPKVQVIYLHLLSIVSHNC